MFCVERQTTKSKRASAGFNGSRRATISAPLDVRDWVVGS